MITKDNLYANFYPVVVFGDGFVRADDELPRTTFHTYFKLAGPDGFTPFATSQDIIDDDFAVFILIHAGHGGVTALTKVELPANAYGFSHVLHVPPAYHSELKGRLDVERMRSTLCVPIHDAEFSGFETVEQFYYRRRHVVLTSQWNRKPPA